ncbi:hypothetical protein OESDEN_07457 [Oesophagostomum dentatum]|uniref:Uncharacterized protein n=1 Tax=Oesophagostomum dentatum TaxID=61180 RepID=A0A0B1T963_OESDE|nr:hypothetical protein OESDEN_07457 [Oesophagostomum dentatum]
MMDPPPCGCIRLPTGKKKRCRKHRKVVELRHAADSESDEDKAIDGAITPDKVCAVGPAGVAVLVDIDKAETAEVGPRATLQNKQRMAGILIKGAHETPQFIPMEKVQKDAAGKPKYRHYTLGRLVRGHYGEAVFFADGQCPYDQYGDPKNMRVTGVDPALQKRIGDTVCLACEVEVNEKGMPIIKQIIGAEDVPKDKSAAVGVMNKNTDGIIVFIQTAGQKLGSSDNAPCVVCTPADKLAPGGVIGKAYQGKDGNIIVLPIGVNPTVPDQKVVGTMLQGTYRQPVYVKDVKRSECPSASNIAVVKGIEKEAKSRLQHIERADVAVQATVQNKTYKEILAVGVHTSCSLIEHI